MPFLFSFLLGLEANPPPPKLFASGHSFWPLPRSRGSLGVPKAEPVMICKHSYGLGRALANSSLCEIFRTSALGSTARGDPGE
jgi:hypothetical protein